MNPDVIREMRRMVDDHFQSEDLKGLLHAFIEDKSAENSLWSSITLSTHYMLGGSSPCIESAAALTELVILALDIVDDLQDQDNVSKPWMKCPQAYTLNAVLSLHAILLTELGRIGLSRLTGDMGRLLVQTIEGQQMDVSQSVVSEADYIAMVRQKSGSLMRLACCMGYSLIDDLDRETVDRMNDLAECIGIMAQIANDVNDVLRYDVKNDLLLKKRTLPILFMLVDSKDEFPPIGQYYEGLISADEFLRHKQACMAYIRDSGCIEYSQVIRTLYADKAEELLQSVPAVSPWRERFKEITFG